MTVKENRMITDDNFDEAMHDYKLVLAYVQSEGGNPIVGMMEHGYTEEESRYIADEYLKRLTK